MQSVSIFQVAYVPGDMLQNEAKFFGGVVEPWWVSSKGIGVYVPLDIPLFYRCVLKHLYLDNHTTNRFYFQLEQQRQ